MCNTGTGLWQAETHHGPVLETQIYTPAQGWELPPKSPGCSLLPGPDLNIGGAPTISKVNPDSLWLSLRSVPSTVS